MLTSKFSQIRNSMHTYSRAPLAKGQKWLDQATAPAGHNVSAENVRSEEIPAIASVAERDMHFLELKGGARVVGGVKGKLWAHTIRFLDRLGIQEIPNTNGESWVVVDEAGNRMRDFIDPADRPLSQYALSEGYELLMYAEDGTMVSRNVGWNFDSFNGIIHFEGKTPKSPDWGFGKVTVEGFVYIGKKVSNVMGSFEETFENVKGTVDEAVRGAIAIQPFKFTTTEMTVVGDPYPLEDSHAPDVDYFQRLSILIPGFVFELTSLDRDETVITEMRHLANGDTQIFLNVPWHVQTGCPIMSYNYDSGQDGIGCRIPVVGKYKFIAMAFTTNSGEKLPMRGLIDYEKNPNDVIPTPVGYELCTPFENGIEIGEMQMPPHPQFSSGYPGCGCAAGGDGAYGAF